MKRLLLGLIWLYQRTLSPDHGPLRGAWPHGMCRFHPTCSDYAREAIAKYGAWRGVRLTAKRLGRCHPGTQGGFDPVR